MNTNIHLCSVFQIYSKIQSTMVDFTAEYLFILFCTIFFPTVLLLVLTIVTLSLFGQSVGFNHYYVSCLLKIFEVMFLS